MKVAGAQEHFNPLNLLREFHERMHIRLNSSGGCCKGRDK